MKQRLEKDWAWIVLAVAAVLLVNLVAPSWLFFWSYRWLKKVFYNDLGFGESWATLAALAWSFLYIAVVPFARRALTFGRRRPLQWVLGLVAVVFVFGHVQLLHALLGRHFDQKTGVSRHWFVIHPDGKVQIFDSGGVDPDTGLPKRPLTSADKAIIDRMNSGKHPNRVQADPDHIVFFDPVTGQPRIWYHLTSEGSYALYDSPGFDPGTGVGLQEATSYVVDLVRIAARQERDRAIERQLAEAESRRLEAAALAQQAAAQKAAREQEAEVQRRVSLARLFGGAASMDGAIVVGVRAAPSGSKLAEQAARAIADAFVEGFKGDNRTAVQVEYALYSSPHFDELLDGDLRPLDEAGLTRKLQGAVFATANATCARTASLAGVVTCNIELRVRAMNAKQQTVLSESWMTNGAGADERAAVSRGVERLVEQYAGKFKRL